MDIRKAFVTIDHKALIRAIRSRCLSDKCISLICMPFIINAPPQIAVCNALFDEHWSNGLTYVDIATSKCNYCKIRHYDESSDGVELTMKIRSSLEAHGCSTCLRIQFHFCQT